MKLKITLTFIILIVLSVAIFVLSQQSSDEVKPSNEVKLTLRPNPDTPKNDMCARYKEIQVGKIDLPLDESEATKIGKAVLAQCKLDSKYHYSGTSKYTDRNWWTVGFLCNNSEDQYICGVGVIINEDSLTYDLVIVR